MIDPIKSILYQTKTMSNLPSITPATPKTAALYRKRAAKQNNNNNTTTNLLTKAKHKSNGDGGKSTFRKCFCGKLEKDCNDPACTVKRTLNRVEENATNARRAKRRLVKNKVKRKEAREIQELMDQNGCNETYASSSSSENSEPSDYEDTNEVPESEKERVFHQQQQIKKAHRQDKEAINKYWICGICQHQVTNHVLISCPSCFRPRGAIKIYKATTVEGVAKTAFEKRRRKQRARGQNPNHAKNKNGKLSSIQLSGLNRKQRRTARIKARVKDDKFKKKPKKKIDVQELTKDEVIRNKKEEKIKTNHKLFLIDKTKAGMNPIKKIKASFRSFFRQKLDQEGTFSNGLKALFGDDYTRDLQGIQRRK